MISLYQQKLFIIYNQAIAKAHKSTDGSKIIQRLNKALGILQSLDYYNGEKAKYQPTFSTCNCDDWKYHNSMKRGYTGHCKHMMSVILMERINSLKYIQTDFFSLCGG